MNLESYIRTVQDFPKPGIGFKDITPLLTNGEALRASVDLLADRYRGKVDSIVGIESRGFIFGGPLAYALGLGLTVIRKPGKLPHDTHSVSYELEYGSDTLEIHCDGLEHGTRVLIVDDLLATGGTAEAAVTLVEKTGAKIVELAFLIELAFLGGRKRLEPKSCHALIEYGDEG